MRPADNAANNRPARNGHANRFHRLAQRIAKALGVDAQDLVDRGEAADLKVVATLGRNGVAAPRRAAIVVPPRADEGDVAVVVAFGVVEFVTDPVCGLSAAGVDAQVARSM